MSKVEKDRKKNKKSYYKHRTKRLQKYKEHDRTIGLQKKYGITPEQWENIYIKNKKDAVLFVVNINLN